MNKRENHAGSAGKEGQSNFNSLDVIQGLLKALQVANTDKNTILFDRIKSVIALMAKGSHTATLGDAENGGSH